MLCLWLLCIPFVTALSHLSLFLTQEIFMSMGSGPVVTIFSERITTPTPQCNILFFTDPGQPRVCFHYQEHHIASHWPLPCCPKEIVPMSKPGRLCTASDPAARSEGSLFNVQERGELAQVCVWNNSPQTIGGRPWESELEINGLHKLPVFHRWLTPSSWEVCAPTLC